MYGQIFTASQKRATFIFLNNSVKHWLIVIIFGMRHRKKLDLNDYSFVHLIIVSMLLCKMQKWHLGRLKQ